MKFWEIMAFAFSACVACQLIYAYPAESNTLKEPKHESSGYNNQNSPLANNNLDLTTRHNILLEFEKYFALLSREAIKVVLADFKALPKRNNDANKRNITALSNTLKLIEDINLIQEPLNKHDVRRVTNIIGDLIHSNTSISQSAVKHEKLTFEMHKLTDRFGEVFDDFIATLTPEERRVDKDLIALHQQYKANDDEHKWEVLGQAWNYFVI